MPDFPHLDIRLKIDGTYNSPYGKGKRTVVIEKSQTTLDNIENRQGHGNKLRESANQIVNDWNEQKGIREADNSPALPEALPLFLEVDPVVFKADDLKTFGIDVIAEDERGFIIGASADMNLGKLQTKIQKFIDQANSRVDKPAQLWEIIQGRQWRIERILSEELQAKWQTIDDNTNYIVDIGVACHVPLPDYPQKQRNETDEHYNEKVGRWETKRDEAWETKDELALARQNELEQFIATYGSVISSYVDEIDSFSCKLQINGKGLKDLVMNYPYLFEVSEQLEIDDANNDTSIEVANIEPILTAPDVNAPKVCVIDSGIQENHRLLELAIDQANSICYIPGEETITADSFRNGGHGTKVAGAVLYSNEIPRNGNYQLICWIQNARILDNNNALKDQLYPPELMKKIVEDFYVAHGTRIFNLSVGAKIACRLKHISPWAAQIDSLSWNNDLLFVISAGNVKHETGRANFPGIREHMAAGRQYPDFLLESSSRIVDPAQSLNALTVGSVCVDSFEDADSKSFGERNDISSFSRTGLGIWGSIKPDVVEYGGDFVAEKAANPNYLIKEQTCSELIRSTFHGGSEVGKDDIGTSYAAPKVSHIVAMLQNLFPNEPSLLYRALVAQSARWPEKARNNENTLAQLRYFGYGIPDINRASENTAHRVTFVNSGIISAKKAHIYSINIPKELKRQGDEYDILMEITLSFKAIPRRTRRNTKSYLSNWLDWESSKPGETFEQFKTRIITRVDENREADYNVQNNNAESFPWTIKNRINAGIDGVRLNESTLQKDWLVTKSYLLPNEFSFAVVGHLGWEKDIKKEVPYSVAVSFEAINRDVEIYEPVRVVNEVEIQQEIRV